MTTIDISTIVFTHGSHTCTDGHCAREALHHMVCGVKQDATPPGLSRYVSCLPALNDMAGWRDDAHRTATLAPYLHRLARCLIDEARERAISERLAGIALRVFAPEALDCAARALRGSGIAPLADHAQKLEGYAAAMRGLPASAAAYAAADAADAAAYAAARDAAWAAAYAADAAAYAAYAAADADRASAAAYADDDDAADAADAAAYAADAAAYAAADADAAERTERYSRLVLDAICDGYAV